MGVTSDFLLVWRWMVDYTVELFDKFIIPGTSYSLLALMFELLLVALVLKVLKYWLGLEEGVFKSHYSDLRRQGKSVSQTGAGLKNRYRR